MNALNRKIEPGEIVILDADLFRDEFHHDLRFECQDGFGLMPFTAGSSISGKWLVDSEQTSIRGSWIDAEATRRYQVGEETWPK